MDAGAFKYTTADLRAAMAAPLMRTEDGLAVSPDEVRALARAAWEKRDPIARGVAERLLFTAHVNNSYAPPTQPTPALLWSVLMEHKLRAELGPFLKEDEISSETMHARLADAVRMGKQANAMVEQIADVKELAIWTKTFFEALDGFIHALVSLTQRTTGAVRTAILHNVNDELVAGKEHSNYKKDLADAVGVNLDVRRTADDPTASISAIALSTFRTGVSLLNEPAFALGAFYSIEAVVPNMCGRLLPKCRGFGLPDSALGEFLVHGEVDDGHAQEWLDVVEASNLDGRRRAYVAAGALAQVEMRRALFEDDILPRILAHRKA